MTGLGVCPLAPLASGQGADADLGVCCGDLGVRCELLGVRCEDPGVFCEDLGAFFEYLLFRCFPDWDTAGGCSSAQNCTEVSCFLYFLRFSPSSRSMAKASARIASGIPFSFACCTPEDFKSFLGVGFTIWDWLFVEAVISA